MIILHPFFFCIVISPNLRISPDIFQGWASCNQTWGRITHLSLSLFSFYDTLPSLWIVWSPMLHSGRINETNVSQWGTLMWSSKFTGTKECTLVTLPKWAQDMGQQFKSAPVDKSVFVSMVAAVTNRNATFPTFLSLLCFYFCMAKYGTTAM